MTERTWAERLAAIAVLDDPVRRDLYEYVARSAEPIGRDAAAAACGVSRSTAAFHLDRLAGEGLLNVEYRRLTGRSGPGAGRPAKLYRRAADGVAVSVPERRYDLAGELLAAAIDESGRTGRPVGDVLAERARVVGREIGAEGESLLEVLERYGFEPRPDGEGGYVLGNCPFHRLARAYTDLICGLNLELLGGVAEQADAAGYALVLDPGPDRCCVRIRPRGDTRQGPDTRQSSDDRPRSDAAG